jgi:hypothetical protein
MFTSLPPVPKVNNAMATRVFVFNTWKNVIDDVSYKKTMLTYVVHKFKFSWCAIDAKREVLSVEFFPCRNCTGFYRDTSLSVKPKNASSLAWSL